MRTHDLDVIRKNLAPGFETDLFAATLHSLADKRNPLRYNNFASSLRETVRNVLERLAPEAEVRRCSWFKNITGTAKLARRERAAYAVQGGLSDDFIRNTLKIDIDGMHKTLTAVVEGLNKYTHVGPDTIGTPDNEVANLATGAVSAVASLFNVIAECRSKIVDTFNEEIDAAAVREILSETILAIDELATHHTIEEVDVGSALVAAIDAAEVRIEVRGVIHCVLQYGSNSDLRNDMGAEIEESFKFQCDVVCPVDYPDELEAVSDSLGVDTTDWHDNRYGLDDED